MGQTGLQRGLEGRFFQSTGRLPSSRCPWRLDLVFLLYGTEKVPAPSEVHEGSPISPPQASLQALHRLASPDLEFFDGSVLRECGTHLVIGLHGFEALLSSECRVFQLGQLNPLALVAGENKVWGSRAVGGVAWRPCWRAVQTAKVGLLCSRTMRTGTGTSPAPQVPAVKSASHSHSSSASICLL